MRTKQILATSVSLTTSLTDSMSSANVNNSGQHTVYIQWTPGTAANVLTFQVFTKAEEGEWTPYMTWSNEAASTRTTPVFTETASGTDPVYLAVDLPREADELKIQYAESEDGSSTKGTISAQVISTKS